VTKQAIAKRRVTRHSGSKAISHFTLFLSLSFVLSLYITLSVCAFVFVLIYVCKDLVLLIRLFADSIFSLCCGTTSSFSPALPLHFIYLFLILLCLLCILLKFCFISQYFAFIILLLIHLTSLPSHIFSFLLLSSLSLFLFATSISLHRTCISLLPSFSVCLSFCLSFPTFPLSFCLSFPTFHPNAITSHFSVSLCIFFFCLSVYLSVFPNFSSTRYNVSFLGSRHSKRQ